MTFQNPKPTAAERFQARVEARRSFTLAAASMRAALAELREAERELELQLADLRSYMHEGADAPRAA